MPFPFSFKFTVQGVSNPFAHRSSSGVPAPDMAKSVDPVTSINEQPNANVDHEDKIPRRAPSPSMTTPLAKKREWVPSSSRPSASVATETFTNGYLDTPAQYRNMEERADGNETDEMVGGELSCFTFVSDVYRGKHSTFWGMHWLFSPFRRARSLNITVARFDGHIFLWRLSSAPFTVIARMHIILLAHFSSSKVCCVISHAFNA